MNLCHVRRVQADGISNQRAGRCELKTDGIIYVSPFFTMYAYLYLSVGAVERAVLIVAASIDCCMFNF